MNWQDIFAPSEPALETIIRGSVMYLVLFFLLRLTLKRVGGNISLGEVLMIALVAAAAQNAMARNHTSVTDGIILVATIAFWSYTLDWLAHRFPWFERYYSPPPILLVKNGKIIHANLRRELITEAELWSQLRNFDIERLAEVAEAYIENDGHITVIRRD
jgi:uncharacterized membrane protein YcaP (DUF421 family)